MVALKQLSLLALMAAAAGCQSNVRLDPRWLDQPAWMDIDAASVVAVGTVVSIGVRHSTTKDLSWFHLVEVSIRVDRILKGKVEAPMVCFTYSFPNGGVAGKLPDFMALGDVGIFSLVPGSPCYQAVDSLHPTIKVYDLPRGNTGDVYQFVAEASLPISHGCPTAPAGVTSNISHVAHSIHRNAMSLIGTSSTHELLARSLGNPDAHMRECSCALMLLTWKIDEPCGRELPGPGKHERLIVESYQRNVKAMDRDSAEFWSNPVEWMMKATADGWDWTIFSLAAILKRSAVVVDSRSCQALIRGFRGGRFVPSSEFRDLDSPKLQRLAHQRFSKWLDLGCPNVVPNLKTWP